MNEKKIKDIIDDALEEDLGFGDITTDHVIKEDEGSTGVIRAKEEGVAAGLPISEKVFERLDPEIKFEHLKEDGESINPGEEMARISGKTKPILKGERVALNFLQRLSGIATKARRYVEKADSDVKIVDTRKTTPNLRILEKYAVRVGGASNHRMGLSHSVLIKDNHIRSAGSIQEAVKRVKGNVPFTTKIEVEVESIEEAETAVNAGADIVMLDNMSLDQMKEAVEKIGDNVELEASGGIELEDIEAVADTGVDIISVGALTHHIEALDISLDLMN
ncbi:MAG: carboxylating nicotinate-nucleotide diphosphorylase [Candidatus Thermoplasmatota archaeon]|nr:carboxylating nicotinate-nucleotide diphosphorylase [Candidatus Thermoplasmatota archaeon]